MLTCSKDPLKPKADSGGIYKRDKEENSVMYGVNLRKS